MKKSWELSARSIAAIFVGWLAVSDGLIGLIHLTDWWPLKVLLFVCLALLPGVVLLRLMRVLLGTVLAGMLYSFGLSVLVLMLSGLAANELLFRLGVARPLDFWGAAGAWNAVTILLIAAATITNRAPLQLKARLFKSFSKPAWLLLGLMLPLPVLAVFGAFRLNNGADALFAELALGYAVFLIGYVFLLRRYLPNGLLAWFTFVLSITILLMTSLRGWDIVGHDIEREFQVFSLTHSLGRWDIGMDRDPYNACLSITILPQMFASLLGVSGVFVFKVILQIIFAACPVVLFVLLRQYVSKLGALVGVLLFICYPTFINDSAMLTRQGIAYLFFALALLIISNKAQHKQYKLLFALCSAGAVLSHYSTAYMFVALFALAVVCKFGLMWWHSRPTKKSQAEGITWWHKYQQVSAKVHKQRTVLSPLFAVLLFAMTFLWYSQITGTSSGLVTTLRQSFANIPQLFNSDNRSSDTASILLFSGGQSQVNLYQSYLTKSLQSHSASQITADFFPSLVADDLPLTQLGTKAKSIGFNPSIIAVMRQNFAKVLQGLAMVGVLFVTFNLLRKKPHISETDFTSLNLASLVILTGLVILPVLSINYGILRAFQQVLIFLLLPIMLFMVRVSRPLWGWLKTLAATAAVAVLFLLFTGFFAQILGGTSPTLSLDNSGLYYGLYYSPASDGASFAWLRQHVPAQADVRLANPNRALMHDHFYPFARTGILPSQTTDASFVYLDQAQVQAQKFYIYYESSPLIMDFPVSYYDQTKNEIFSTAATRIYR
ncbi:MAG TPA: DUF2206 domain-containing protein [Candidatus Acidoferrum sp.]|nr:DUF2206 domain-containing protein [Candidatus Acidoferrum sp.]